MIRYALVKADRQVPAYMPGNYRVVATVPYLEGESVGDERLGGYLAGEQVMVIAGEDVAGWALDSYVIPRLGSGLHTAFEVGLDHPVMAAVDWVEVAYATSHQPGEAE